MNDQQGGIPFPYLSIILLLMIVFTIFLVPAFPPDSLQYLYPVCFTIIFLIAAVSLQKHRKHSIIGAFTLIGVLWISIIAELGVLVIIARIIQFLFFFYLVARLVIQIANTTTVTGKVILDSITGYLLMGMAYSTLVMLLSFTSPGSYNFKPLDLTDNDKLAPVSDYFYYTFITYTTTGYGDFLPLTPMAKSLAMMIGITGQLYVAIIIAMLVGKYATSRKN
jgi:hypothetical protein